jgi:hypothetical protein
MRTKNERAPTRARVGAPAWSLSIALLKQHRLLESATCRENSDEAEMVLAMPAVRRSLQAQPSPGHQHSLSDQHNTRPVVEIAANFFHEPAAARVRVGSGGCSRLRRSSSRRRDVAL